MKRVIRCMTFLVLFALVFSYVTGILTNKSVIADYVSPAEMLYSTEDDLIDAVFIGSSHTFCTVYPSVIWNESGVAAFDMTACGQDKLSSIYALKEVLKTQSPKVVFAEMFSLLYDDPPYDWMIYWNAYALKPSLLSFKYLYEYIDEEDRKDYLLRYPIIHTRYRELCKYDFVSNPVNGFSRGERVDWHVTPGHEVYDREHVVTKVTELSDKNKAWLDELREMSEEEGFELVFFLAPFNGTDKYKAKFNGAKEYASSYGIKYYDLNYMDGEFALDYDHDWLDGEHLNGYGATKASSYLAAILSEELELSDHRNDERYKQWDMDSKYYFHSMAETHLEDLWDPVEYCKYAESLDDVVIYYSIDGEFANIVDRIKYIGIPDEEIGNGGKWMWKDGTLTKLMDNSDGNRICHDYSRFDNVMIQYVADNPEASIMVNGESAIEVHDGVNIVVYDTFNNRILGSKQIGN